MAYEVTAAGDDPFDPAAVAAASFPVVRQGYDPDDVHRFLAGVADALAEANLVAVQWRDRAEVLDRELDDLWAAMPDTPGAAPDDDRVVRDREVDDLVAERLLEAAEVVREAYGDADSVRAQAEADAEAIVAGARDEAARIVAAARAEVDEVLRLAGEPREGEPLDAAARAARLLAERERLVDACARLGATLETFVDGLAVAEPASTPPVVERRRRRTAPAIDSTAARAPDPAEGRFSSAVRVISGPPATSVADAPAPTEPDAHDEGGIDAAAPATPDDARAAAVATAERTLGRRIKRLLADEENELLDELRRQGPDDGPRPSRLSAAARRARLAEAVVPALRNAATAGAELELAQQGGRPHAVPRADVDDLADELASSVVDPLRARLAEVVESAAPPAAGLPPRPARDELIEEVRAVYRELRSRVVRRAVADAAEAAVARGEGVARRPRRVAAARP